jgi:hypothetical protein
VMTTTSDGSGCLDPRNGAGGIAREFRGNGDGVSLP